ncbi:efflux RND transporter periplasmic adaptor subunit [Candidatus Fermentibacteria bacterium]|nr:efflux RND transporter periplasmic adaptor subunit [Candidatus Fermentibacteria bacterium]
MTDGVTMRQIGAGAAISLLAAVLIGVLLLGGCGARTGSDSAGADSTAAGTAEVDSGEAAAGSKEKAISVEAAMVWKGNLVTPIHADGAIRTPQSVEIRTKVGGDLVSVNVRDGDRVQKGQVIALLDQREFMLAVEESRHRYLAALAQAVADADSSGASDDVVEEFRRQRQELEDLQRRGTKTKEHVRQRTVELEMQALKAGAYRGDLFAQRTGLADARITEERARLSLEHSRITAPFAGTVHGVAVVAGATVSAGSVICRLVNNEQVEAAVNVLETDLGDLEEGRPALVVIPATGDTVAAFVSVISPILDEASRTCQVIMRFANPRMRLRSGMFARAQIAGFIYPDRLLVSTEAVLTRSERPLVFKVNGDRAQWLYVETGQRNDQWVEITSVSSGGSLAPGDRVVISDHLTLAHEARIQVRTTRDIQDRWITHSAHGTTP